MAIDKFGNKTAPHAKKYNEDNRFHCIDKEKRHHSVYIKDVYALELRCDYTKNKAELKDWSLVGPDKIYAGKTISDFMNTLCTLIDKYSLKEYSNTCFYKDQVMIYTENMAKALGILQDAFKVSSDSIFKDSTQIKQFTIFDYFVISMTGGWTDAEDVIDIYNDMTNVMNTVFIPNSRVYLTPYQYNRKRLKKLNVEPSVVPKNIGEHTFWRNAYYGGAAFSKRNITYKMPIIEYDRKSAYLYEYFMPHMSGPLKEINTSEWKRWLDNFEVTNSVGTYSITFEMTHRLLNIFNSEKRPWQLNKEYTIKITLLSIDLKLFMQCADIKSITCTSLFEYEVSMLPKSVIDHIVQCYINKETYKDLLHKKIANANYGSLCMDLDKDKIKELKKKPYYSPMWGYEIAAYARQHLYDCGKNLQGWIYSDTDSIFCMKTPENEVIINEYNMYMQKVIKKACEYYDLNFESIKKIGLFKFETEITEMIVRGIRTYAYVDVEGNFVQKASGMCDDANNTISDWESDDELDYGTRVRKEVNEDGYFEYREKNYMEPNLNMSGAMLFSILKINQEEV